MSNPIAIRISDFLKDFEPFSYLEHEDLVKIANSIKVINLEKNKILFQIDDSLHDSFYVVASGVIHLSVVADAEETLLNKCYAGDIFGLRPFFAKNNYQMTATAREESVVYAIPIDVFKPYVAKYQDVLSFLLESFATNSKSSLFTNKKLISDNIGNFSNQIDTQFFQSLQYNKTPIKVLRDATIQETARIMTENLIDSAVIIENNLPIGIVTDKDFRSKIATGKTPTTHTISEIMSAPVVAVTENISVAEAQLIMLKHDVTHLVVTQDGTDKSEVKGIIAEHDLIVAQANNPGVLLKEIKKAKTSKELKQVRDKLTDIIQTSLQKNIPLPHLYSLAGEITLAIIKRAVEQSILDFGSPPTRFAWISIGSQGRKEQLLYTDQDSMLIFEDVPENKFRDVKDYYLKLAKKTVSTLEKVGYSLCENHHIASNMQWCKPLSECLNQYSSWINTPGESTSEVSSIFFDYELAFGEQKMEDAISELIYKNNKNNTLFLDFLGNDALKKPSALNFFKKFNVEEDGEHKGKFDIKNRAIMPLIDGARLMSLYLGIKGINNTYLRYKQLAIVDPKFAEIYLNCAEAFLILSRYQTIEGIKNDSTGQYINLDELNKVDKEKIKDALNPMRELEEMIKDRIQLTQFS